MWWFDSPQAIWSQTRGAPGGISSWRTDTCYHMDQWGWEPCLYTLARRLSTGRTGRKRRRKIPSWTFCSVIKKRCMFYVLVASSKREKRHKSHKNEPRLIILQIFWITIRIKCCVSVFKWELIYLLKRGVKGDTKTNFNRTDTEGVVRVSQSSGVISVRCWLWSS